MHKIFSVSVTAIDEEPLVTPTVLFQCCYIPSLGNARTFDVAPDRRFLALKPAVNQDDGTTSETADLVVVQNWFTELTELVPVAQ